MPTINDDHWIELFLETMEGQWRKDISDEEKEQTARELLAEAKERGRQAAKAVAGSCTCHFHVPEATPCPLHDA